jgi:hypothetical protein
MGANKNKNQHIKQKKYIRGDTEKMAVKILQ